MMVYFGEIIMIEHIATYGMGDMMINMIGHWTFLLSEFSQTNPDGNWRYFMHRPIIKWKNP